MIIKPFELGTPLKIKELEVGMKVLFGRMNDLSGEIYDIRRISRLMNTTKAEQQFGSDRVWIKFENDKREYPYWGDTIYPLTKRAKTELLLKGDKSGNQQKRSWKVPAVW